MKYPEDAKNDWGYLRETWHYFAVEDLFCVLLGQARYACVEK